MMVIGLTGGIGSGKTEATKLFKKLGADVIDADQIVHALLQPDEPTFQTIVEHCGLDILTSHAALDRKKLRQRMFQDPELKHWMESLIHPLVRERMKAFIARSTAPYVVLVIPLLIETLPHPLVQRICVVDAPVTLQRERTRKRDQLDKQSIDAIINQQASRDTRLAHADDVIDNTGDLAHLAAQVKKLHQQYVTLANH